MSSVVYYRFRSSKNPQRLTFDGTGISIFDLKRGIVLAQHLDATADTFQLTLTNPDTGEAYDDDSEVLPRSTLVEARRLPTARPGSLDSAMQYVSGSLAVNAKNAARREVFSKSADESEGNDGSDAALTYLANSGNSFSANTEQDMMNAMFAQQGAQWSRTQQEMATKTKVFTPRPPSASMKPGEPNKTLPPGYVCHRCGQKGHWITNCPSLYDRNWETKKVLRTTGIPKSMLRAASGLPPTGNGEDDEDGRTYLMNADGEYVVAVADDKSWADFQARQLQQQARALRPVPTELQDPSTHKFIRTPRKMPCCGKVYDEQSIVAQLIQMDFRCPSCGKTEVYIDQLERASDMEAKIKAYLETESGGDNKEENKEESKEENKEKSNGDEVMTDAESDEEYFPGTPGSASSPGTPGSVASPGGSTASGDLSEPSQSRKRRRSSENDEKPKFPMMMPPFMFNPFMMMMPTENDQHEDTDYESGDERPVQGRIR